jgi:hypothetical protein
MMAKLTRLTHKIAIELHLVAESCITCSSRSRWPVRKLLDTPSSLTAETETVRNCKDVEEGDQLCQPPDSTE